MNEWSSNFKDSHTKWVIDRKDFIENFVADRKEKLVNLENLYTELKNINHKVKPGYVYL